MLFEVIKNSVRAVVEFHGVDNHMPPIKIVIADGEDNEDVSIKISDEGGGILRSSMSRIWSYLYTTADSEVFERLEAPNDFGGDSPLAGLGYGLPISRLFARCFGSGDFNGGIWYGCLPAPDAYTAFDTCVWLYQSLQEQSPRETYFHRYIRPSHSRFHKEQYADS